MNDTLSTDTESEEPSEADLLALDDTLARGITSAQQFTTEHAVSPLVDLRGLLTYQMEFALTVTIKAALDRAGGDFKLLDHHGQLALSTITQYNQRLVSFVTRRYLSRGVSEEDLNQEGMIGLLFALKRFDPYRGYKFSTYAYWWIRQYVLRVIAEHGRTIRVPSHSIDLLNRVAAMQQELAITLGRTATSLELASALSTTVDSLRAAYDAAPPLLSLDTPRHDEEEQGIDVAGGLSDPEALAFTKESRAEVSQVMSEFLTTREATVLKLRLGMHPRSNDTMMTLEEVGDQLGLTRERIRQIEERALKKLRGRHVRSRLETFIRSA